MSKLIFGTMRIRDFKSFKGFHVFNLNRAEGVYYVTGINKVNPKMGANGAGKTSLWDALTWCLWGRTGRDNRPSNTIVARNTEGNTKVSVSMSRNGVHTKIVRTRNPNRLYDAATKKELTQQQVEEIIGMSESMFKRSIVLAQFGTLFLDMGPEEQSRMFDDALDLKRWLRASDTAKAKSKTLENAFREKQGQLEALQGRQHGLIEELKAARTAKAKHKEKIEVKRTALQLGHKRLLEKLKETLTGGTVEDLRTKKLKASRQADDARVLLLQYTRQEGEASANYSSTLKAHTKLCELGPTCETCGQKISKDTLRTQLQEAGDRLAVAKMKRNKIKAIVEELNSKINDYTVKSNSYSDKLSDIVRATANYTEAENKLKGLDVETNPHIETIKRLKAKAIELEETKNTLTEELTLIEADMQRCQFWQKAFREIRLSLIDSVLEELGMTVTSHAEALGLDGWRIEFKTERNTKGGTVNSLFQTMLYPPKSNNPVKWESYSGGESQRWQLAVAFGLSEIVLARAGITPNIEVLDEPTKGMSPEGVEILLEQLRERAEELNKSIYVVEHHSLERGAFNDTITITKNKEGSSIN